MIAVLLKHTNMLSEALHYGTTLLTETNSNNNSHDNNNTTSTSTTITPVPPRLEYVWRFAARMRAFLMNKEQEMRTEEGHALMER